jgi:hypothetical protein
MEQPRDHRTRRLIKIRPTRLRSAVNAIVIAISMSPASHFVPAIGAGEPRSRERAVHPIEGRSSACIGGDRFLRGDVFMNDINRMNADIHPGR